MAVDNGGTIINEVTQSIYLHEVIWEAGFDKKQAAWLCLNMCIFFHI